MSLRTTAAAALGLFAALPVAAQNAGLPAGQPAPESGYADSSPTPRPGVMSSLGGSGATGPDSVGTLPQRDTGFDRNTWRDTRFDLVLRLLDSLPDRIDSAASHELAKNLLVSVADAPPGDDGDSKMLLRRVRKLMAIGNVDDAAALARAAPGLPADEELARLEVEAELLAGQVESACIDLRAFSTTISASWVQNGMLLCRQHAGEAIEGGVPALDAEALGPLARILGTPLPVDPANAPPARLVAAARDGKLPPEQRLAAAFAAGRASALPGSRLATIFGSTAARVDIAADPGAPADGVTAAALYQAIARHSDPEQKVALAERGLLSPEGALDKVGVAMVNPLGALQASADLQVLAPRLAMLFYGVGDSDTASHWADIAVQSGAGAVLWPYRVLLKQADAVEIADWQQQSGLDPARAARVLTILSAFDVTRPPAGGASVAGEDRPEPPFADLVAMDQAARNLHAGETVARALAVLGQGGPALAHPLALRRVLADIDQGAQMHDEARALAFEAITATLLGH